MENSIKHNLSIYPQEHGGMYILYIALFFIAASMLARSVYYFRLKVSAIDGPMLDSRRVG